MSVLTRADLLTDDMLARFDERAPSYDRENRFFDEDWEELKASGYLLGPVPTELGGYGLGLDEYAALARRLAYVAPATALATNMHCSPGTPRASRSSTPGTRPACGPPRARTPCSTAPSSPDHHHPRPRRPHDVVHFEPRSPRKSQAYLRAF